MNEIERNKLLGIEGEHNHASFDGALVIDLDTLVEAGELDPEETQNNSPTAGKMLEFMREHPGVTAHGYVIGGGRDDKRVTLEGLEYRGEIDPDLMKDFVDEFRQADEFTLEKNYFRCWYD